MKIKAATLNEHWRRETTPQLKLEGGKLKAIDGTEPDFEGFPDGEVVIVGRKTFLNLVDDAGLLRNIGA